LKGRECYHCKQWVAEGEAHDCWTTTEAALTADLSEDLRDAWERLRETAQEFGEQRIYASFKSIMFSRKACYMFVRPKAKFLEVVLFLNRPIIAPQIRKVVESSRTKRAHILRITHRDQVEGPVADWMREAYDFSVAAKALAATTKASQATRPASRKQAKAKSTAKPVAKTSQRPAVSRARRTKTAPRKRRKA
jgi:hypothetical protein